MLAPDHRTVTGEKSTRVYGRFCGEDVIRGQRATLRLSVTECDTELIVGIIPSYHQAKDTFPTQSRLEGILLGMGMVQVFSKHRKNVPGSDLRFTTGDEVGELLPSG